MFTTRGLKLAIFGLAMMLCLTTQGEEPAKPTTVPPLRLKPATPVEQPNAEAKEANDKQAAREAQIKKLKERQEQLLKQYEEQQAKEKADALAKQAEYPYQSTKFIPVKNDETKSRLFSFCMSPDQKLYCLLKPSTSPYEIQIVDGKRVKSEQTKEASPEVVVLNLEGEELQRWSVGFKPDRITTTVTGEVFVGGAGKLAKFSPQGKQLLEVDLPHIAEVLKDEAEIKTAAIEERDEQLEMYQEQVKHYEQLIEKKKEQEEKAKAKKAEKKDGKTEEAEPKKESAQADGIEIEGAIALVDDGEDLDHNTMMLRLSMKQLNSMLTNMQKQVDRLKEKSDEDLVNEFKQSLASKNTIHALTMAGNSLVYTTRQVRGYGYAVWKLNADLAEPVKILQGLGGCCGQCDVQCLGDKLYVADNTKHRVTVYDLNGKKLEQYGKKGRDGDGENFGGCCNPMNVSFTSTGQILTAESEGYIKCFSATGEFEALLGRSLLEAGCKHVALNITKDSKYIVFLDQPGSRLVRLEKSTVPVKPADKTTSTKSGTDKASE
jgi:hypothetical protein